MLKLQRSSSGFTLIELIIVIAIIGILATISLASLNSAREKASVTAAKAELRSIRTAMELLWSDTGVYPNGLESYCNGTVPDDNEVNLNANAAGLVANGNSWTGWEGPYIQSAVDPWGTSYYLDEDYQCLAGTEGCGGVTDSGQDSRVIVSCGPNADTGGSGGSCAYDEDNIVLMLCR